MTCIRIRICCSAGSTPCVLDNVLADRAMRRNTGLVHASRRRSPIGHYIVITAPENTALRDQVDRILRDAMRDGTLEAIFRKWNVWNDDQPRALCACWPTTAGDHRHAALGAAGTPSAP